MNSKNELELQLNAAEHRISFLRQQLAELEQFKEWTSPQIARPVEQFIIDDTNRQLDVMRQQLADAQKRIAIAVKIYELSPLHVNGTFVVHPAHNMLYVLTMPMDELNQFLLEHPEYKEQA